MTVLLKALLLSGMFLSHDNVIQKEEHRFLLHNANEIMDLERAADLLTRSSYVELVDGDSKGALELQKEACDLGSGKACWYYANVTGSSDDLMHAQSILEQQCFMSVDNMRNAGEACTYLGIMISQNKTVGVQNHSEQMLYTRACTFNDGWGCYLLARDFLIDEDFMQAQAANSKALQLLSEECDLGVATSCYFAGVLYESPFIEDWVDGKTRERKMQYFFARGCDLGDGDSCVANTEFTH